MMGTLPSLLRAAGPAMLVTTAAAYAVAGDVSAAGLQLDEVVRATLSSSPEIEIAARRIELQEGALLAARGDFDVVLQTNATASRLNVLDAQGDPAVQRSFGYGLRAQRLLRNGVLIGPEVSLSHSELSTAPGEDANAADVKLGISIPMLRNRGGAATAAAERAIARDLRASRWDRRHVAAERVLSAVVAYWDYLAARRRLDVLISSEERARRTVDQTRVLVEADERTPADLIQLRGNLASKRAARIAAEQGAIEARAGLGLIMGLAAHSALSLAEPATDFPKRRPGAVLDAARLVEAARRLRADLAAADEVTRSARIRLDAAQSEQRPRLDLGLRTGYTATETGRGSSGFFSPLYEREPQFDAIVDLTFELPLWNSAARGRMAQSASLYEQNRIAGADLRRRIAAGVALATEALARGVEMMTETEEAVRLFDAGVQAVQRKFELGASTLFDLLQAQDALTNAQLAHVQSQRDYAVAIARLRFQSGRLVEGDGDGLTVAAASLLAPP